MIVIDLLGETEDGLVHVEKVSTETDLKRKKSRPKEDIPRPALQIVPGEPAKRR